MKDRRRVNSEKLARFGFSVKEIQAAEKMEEEGLFEMEPSIDLVNRTIEKCAATLNHNGVIIDDVVELPTPLRLAHCFEAVKELPAELLKSAEWNHISRLQELQEACLATAQYAYSRRERPFVMLDNHNLIEPSWWNSDTGFRAFRNACQIANKIAVQSGVLPAECVVVLRPTIEDYSNFDVEAIAELLRTGTGDLWWIPYQSAGQFKGVDLVVLGEERTWELREKTKSPAEAMDAFCESINQSEASRLRNDLKHIARTGTAILTKGSLTVNAAAQLKTPGGVRSLMDNVMSQTYVRVGG